MYDGPRYDSTPLSSTINAHRRDDGRLRTSDIGAPVSYQPCTCARARRLSTPCRVVTCTPAHCFRSTATHCHNLVSHEPRRQPADNGISSRRRLSPLGCIHKSQLPTSPRSTIRLQAQAGTLGGLVGVGAGSGSSVPNPLGLLEIHRHESTHICSSPSSAFHPSSDVANDGSA
jgi:hypothetical protein